MIRRLRIAGVGLGMFLVPACMSNTEIADPYYTGGKPGYVLMNRPGMSSGISQRPMTDNRTDIPMAANSKFGPNTVTELPKVEPSPYHLRPPETKTPEQPAAYEQPTVVESPLSDRKQWPLIATNGLEIPQEPNKPSSVIAPAWPHFGSPVAETGIEATPKLLPTLDAPPAVAAPSLTRVAPPAIVPPTDPMPTIGASMKNQEPISPISAPTGSSTDETTLVRAIKAFQNNRPDEAVDLLKRLDPSNQEVLLYLMPLMVRLSEGNLNTLPPDELAMLIDRLQTASSMLKAKASLRIERAMFCRGVRKFADVDPYDPRHEFRPGDMVFLYAELTNFSCEAVTGARQVNGATPTSKGVAIRLGAMLELRDAQNNLLWRTDLSKNDFAQTPPRDYYHTYRFCIPEKLPPGAYTLWLTVTDKPSGRAVRKPIELKVGQN